MKWAGKSGRGRTYRVTEIFSVYERRGKASGGLAHQYMVKLAFEAMKVTAVLNQGYHEPEEIFVITKLPTNQFANAEEAVDEALDKLDIEYIDMMLLHHPGDHDGSVPGDGAGGGGRKNLLHRPIQLVCGGDGVFAPGNDYASHWCRMKFTPYYQENDVILLSRKKGIVVQGWYPFGGQRHGGTARGRSDLEIAEVHGVTSAQVIASAGISKRVWW